MNIKHMRLVLPPRMRGSAPVDARVIAESAARALYGHGGIDGPIRIKVEALGRPARLIAGDVARAAQKHARLDRRGET